MTVSPQGPTPDFSSQIPDSPLSRARLWIFLGLSVAAGLVAAGFALAFVTAPQRQPGTPALGQVVGTIASLAALVFFARAAAELEHRLRRHRPEAQALEAAHTARRARLRRHRHRFSPASMSTFCAFTTCVTLALVAFAVRAQSLDSRSAFVQGHGVRVTGIVVAVHNHQYCQAVGGGAGTSACIPRADMRVKLTRSVGGASTTTVYYPYLLFLRRGQRVTVAVDRHQPGYAELPGHRYRGAGGWIIFAVAAALVSLLALAEARTLAHVLAVKRRHQTRTQEPGVASSAP